MKTAYSSLLNLLVLTGFAGAALTPVFEYSFPASYDGTGFTWTDQSAAGNNGHTHDDVADRDLVDDRPAGFDTSLMCITGSNGAHGRTDAIDLLNNTDIAAAGGFTFDVWFKWEGTYTNTRKLIDYSGTEALRTNSSTIQFILNDGGNVLSSPIVANQWYHAVAVFDTTGNVPEADPGHAGEQQILGNAFLFLDGVLVASAENIYKSGFGDSLDRGIGLNQHPNGGDWNQGWIFNPSVYLGIEDFDPLASVTPVALDFGAFGSSPGAQTLDVTITNDGASQPLTINGLQVTDDLDAVFSVGAPPAPIAPGGSVNVTVTFDPGVLSGEFAGTLEIDSDSQLQALLKVPLTAQVYDPIAVVTPTALDFGEFASSPGVQTMDVTIANNGTTNSLSILNIQVIDDPDVVFTVGTFPATVAPGGSTNVTISFNPAALDGFFGGTLQIDTDGDNQAFFDIPLSAGVKLANPDSSLVSYFTFDDDGNLGDDTGIYDNDGTAVGDARQTTASRIGGGALLLDGDGDLIQLPAAGDDYTNQVLLNFEGFTLACWAIIPSGSPSVRSRFFSAYDTIGGWGAGHWSPTDLVATTFGVVDYVTVAGSAPARGAWHHFAYVFRNDPVNRVDYYVDGVLVDSQTRGNAGVTSTLDDFAIGAKGSTGATEYVDGRIDDLRIYDRELLADNIADLFNSAPPLSGYDAWADSYGLDPAGNGAPDQDPDRDGFDNGAEFMLGTSPIDSTQSNLPVGDTDGTSFTYVYERKTEATAAGFTDSVEFGTDLENWETAMDTVNGVSIVVVPVDAETEEVTVTIPLNGADQMYARLVVTGP